MSVSCSLKHVASQYVPDEVANSLSVGQFSLIHMRRIVFRKTRKVRSWSKMKSPRASSGRDTNFRVLSGSRRSIVFYPGEQLVKINPLQNRDVSCYRKVYALREQSSKKEVKLSDMPSASHNTSAQ